MFLVRLNFLININVFKIFSQELNDSEQYSSPVDSSLAKMVKKYGIPDYQMINIRTYVRK